MVGGARSLADRRRLGFAFSFVLVVAAVWSLVPATHSAAAVRRWSAEQCCGATPNPPLVFDGSGSATSTQVSTIEDGGAPGGSYTETVKNSVNFSWHAVYQIAPTYTSQVEAAGRSWNLTSVQEETSKSTFQGTSTGTNTVTYGTAVPASCSATITNQPGIPLNLAARRQSPKGEVQLAVPAHIASMASPSSCPPRALDDTCDPLVTQHTYGGEIGPITGVTSYDPTDPASSTSSPSVSKGWSCGSSDGQSHETGSVQWSGTISSGGCQLSSNQLAADLPARFGNNVALASNAVPGSAPSAGDVQLTDGPRLTAKPQPTLHGCGLEVEGLEWGGNATPVTADQINQQPLRMESSPSGDCGLDESLEWIACTNPSSPDRAWPVTIVRDSDLYIKEVDFRWVDPQNTTDIADATLKGSVTLGSGKGELTVKRTGINIAAGSKGFSVDDLKVTPKLPNYVDLADPTTIVWTLETEKKTLSLGTVSTPVFVTFAAPKTFPIELAPKFPFIQQVRPFLTLAYLATKAATGADDRSTVVDAIYRNVFQSQGSGLYHVNLDPTETKGLVEQKDVRYSFWPPGWKPAAKFANAYPPTGAYCAHTADGMMEQQVAACQGFGAFTALMMQSEGLSFTTVAPSEENGFVGIVPHHATYFVVGRWNVLARGSASATIGIPKNPDFPLVDGIVVNGNQAHLNPNDYDFLSDTGQNNASAPAMWRTDTLVSITGSGPQRFPADHVLVKDQSDGDIYDPSYGTGPFKSVLDWAKQSIVAWAIVVDQSGKRLQPDTTGDINCADQAPNGCFVEFQLAHGG